MHFSIKMIEKFMEVRYAKYRFKDRWRNLINGSKFKSDTTISTFLNKVEEKRAW